MSKIAGPLTWALALGVGISIGRLLRRWQEGRRDELGGLSNVVSHSSRVIAAWRALEQLEEQPLFLDPFALELTGPRAFAEALAAAKLVKGGTAERPALMVRRCRQLTNVTSRVWWFDRQLLAALSTAAAAGQCNVVLLGSGMDTRPWRLALPPGVHWFEIDRREVLDAKGQALQRMGVQLSQGDGAAPARHRLRAESWAAVEADLCSPSWVAELAAAGFDPGRPTVWVAEGLLMYLTQAEVEALLQEMAEASAPGSVLIFHQVTDELVRLIHDPDSPDFEHPPFTRELMRTWVSGLPRDPTEVLARAGWRLELAASRAQIAHEACGGRPAGLCDFETRVGEGNDRFAVFGVARKDG